MSETVIYGENPPEKIKARLKTLHDVLEAEGSYVRSNTVWLAQEYIKSLEAKVKELEDASTKLGRAVEASLKTIGELCEK